MSCRSCVDQCPVGAIKVIDERCVINENECLDCGTCEDICPNLAILVSRPEEPKKEEPKEWSESFYAINRSKCTGCGECVQSCSLQAVFQNGDGSYCIDKDLCLLCGSCEQACTCGAIEIIIK